MPFILASMSSSHASPLDCLCRFLSAPASFDLSASEQWTYEVESRSTCMVFGQAPDVSASLAVLVRMTKSQDIFHYTGNCKKCFSSASGGHVGVRRCSALVCVCGHCMHSCSRLLFSLASQTHFCKEGEGSGELCIQAMSRRTVQCGPITLQYFVTWCITSLFEQQ